MSDLRPDPDDELVSAVADGEATPAESARVAADPRLAARLAEFFAVSDAVGGPVPLVDPDVRDAHIERALSAAGVGVEGPSGPLSGEQGPAEQTPVADSPPPPPTPPPPPAPVADLEAARARRRPPRIAHAALSAAAVVAGRAVAGALVLRAGDTGGGDADTAAAPSAATAGNDDAGAASAPEAFDPRADDAGGGGDAASEAADSLAQGEGLVDQELPSLGTFTRVSDLANQVRGELTLNSSPPDRESDEPCRDDFPVEVILLGRATLDAEEGLVYVEAATVADRRLWIVQPGDGEACTDLAPVTEL